MKKIYINILLDRSGSMSKLTSDVLGGINVFLDNQRKDAKEKGQEIIVNLDIFDNETENVFKNVNINDCPELTSDVYYARGGTAYLDALGRSIGNSQAYYDSLPEKDRPNKILTVVHTDGEEWASKEFTKAKIKNLVEEKTKEGWNFAFLGADIDATSESSSMGIAAGSTLQYTNTPDGTNELFQKLNCSISEYKCDSSVGIGVNNPNYSLFVDKEK